MATPSRLIIKRKVQLSSSPRFLPPATPLTIDQANQLISVSGIPPEFDDLKGQLATMMVEVSQGQDPKKRRRFETLLKLASHVCSKEGLEGNVKRILERIAEVRESGESEDLVNEIRKGFVAMTAIYLVDGFDVVNESHYTFDEYGNITGFHGNKAIAPKCDAALKARPWRPGAPDVGYGGKKKQRQTKKKTIKKRKTLRRVRH